MGSKRAGGAARERDSSPVTAHQLHGETGRQVSEVPVPGSFPRFEIRPWRDRYHVVAGITGRGPDPGRGFDLGLWSKEPVGEVMDRWLAFRREMSDFTVFALGNQVHGTELMSLDSGRGWVYVDGIDGWITTTPGVLLTVTVADCIPVYLIAPGRGVALLHAGWRGVASGILGRGLDRLQEATNCSPGEVVMYCGVGICGECYEVGSEVMHGCGVPPSGTGPWRLDLRSTLGRQAREAGLIQVSMSTWCSAHDRSSFYSHRASRGVDGRMVAYIGIPRE